MELKYILESVLFSAQEPLSVKDLRDVLKDAAENNPEANPFKKVSPEEITAALEALAAEHEQGGAKFSPRLRCGALAVRHAAGIHRMGKSAGR